MTPALDSARDTANPEICSKARLYLTDKFDKMIFNDGDFVTIRTFIEEKISFAFEVDSDTAFFIYEDLLEAASQSAQETYGFDLWTRTDHFWKAVYGAFSARGFSLKKLFLDVDSDNYQYVAYWFMKLRGVLDLK